MYPSLDKQQPGNELAIFDLRIHSDDGAMPVMPGQTVEVHGLSGGYGALRKLAAPLQSAALRDDALTGQ